MAKAYTHRAKRRARRLHRRSLRSHETLTDSLIHKAIRQADAAMPARGEPLWRYFLLGKLDRAQYEAGCHYRDDYRDSLATKITTYGESYGGSGGFPVAALEACTMAAQAFRAARDALRQTGLRACVDEYGQPSTYVEQVTTAICCGGQSLSDTATGATGGARTTALVRLRRGLEILADHYKIADRGQGRLTEITA